MVRDNILMLGGEWLITIITITRVCCSNNEYTHEIQQSMHPLKNISIVGFGTTPQQPSLFLSLCVCILTSYILCHLHGWCVGGREHWW